MSIGSKSKQGKIKKIASKNKNVNQHNRTNTNVIIMTPMGFQKYELLGRHYKIRLLKNPHDGSFEITTENENTCKELKYEYRTLTKEILQYFKGKGDFDALPSKVKDDIANSII
jgi:hypothetical protein